MEENLKQEREQLPFLISFMQILCNFACLVEPKLWSVIALLTLFCVNHNNLLLDTGTSVGAINFILPNHTLYEDQVQTYFCNLYFILTKHHASKEMN